MSQSIALLFPGQAAQHVGMGRLAAERFPQARAVFDRVDTALGEPISRICFEGPAEQLQETRWQQPAIFACSLALYMAWRLTRDTEEEQIICAAGHSLGEYSALVAASALSLEDGARLVALRGRLMQEAADQAPGGMYAVLGLDHVTVAAICAAVSDASGDPAETVLLANDNAPEQQVISGGTAALERAAAQARAHGAKRVVLLKVAGAFHSPLMMPAAEGLAAAIAATPLSPCQFPVIANSSCAPLETPDDVRAELMRQLTSPVRWVETVRAMAAMAPDLWVDTGPGSVMAGLATRIVPGVSMLSLSSQIDAPMGGR